MIDSVNILSNDEEQSLYMNLPKKVLIRFYDSSNLGDDLFIKILADRYKNVEFDVPTYGNSLTQLDSPNLNNVALPFHRRYFVAAGLLLGVANLHLLVLSKIRTYDLMIYVGGSIFIEMNQLRKWSSEARFYRLLNIPYYIIGANIGPYKSGKFLDYVKSILSGAKDTCLRDEYSYNLVKDLPNTRLATDVAFCLDTTSYPVKNHKVAIFSLIDGYRKFDKEIADRYEREVIQMTARLVENGYSVVYMSFCEEEGDEIANARIIRGLSSATRTKVQEYNYRGNLKESLLMLASSEIIIGSRFHANILGLIFGKKIIPFAYSNKTIDILKDLNFSGDIVDIRSIKDGDTDRIDFKNLSVTNIVQQKKYAENQFLKLDKVLLENNK